MNVEQAVVQRGPGYLDMIRQVEFAFEGTIGNSLMQVVPSLRFASPSAPDGQYIPFDLNLEFVEFETGHGERNQVFVFPGRLDVVRRIAGMALIGAYSESTWDYRAYYGLPASPSGVWPDITRWVIVFIVWGALLLGPALLSLRLRRRPG